MADSNDLRLYAATLFRRDGGLSPPAEVLLNWPTPNYIDPEERGWAAPSFLLVMLGITVLVFGARLWARLVIAKNAGLDDLLTSLAMIPLLGLTVSSILALKVYGFQWHAWDQTNESHITTRQVTMSIELNYLLSTTLVKVSILCFYRRFTGSLTNTFVYWSWGSIAVCIIYGITFALLIIFTCSPVVGYWHLFDLTWRLQNKVSCHNEGAIIIACAAISTVQDFIICMLPAFLIWNLQITKRQKFALCGIFGMGLVTCVCGIMRTYYGTIVYYFTYDITWYAYPGWVWTVLEAQLAVICASAPALKVFFRRYFSAVLRTGYSGSGSRQTPLPLSRSRGYGKITPLQSAQSATRSQIVAGGSHDSDIPLGGIKISQGLDVHVEERDDKSRKSYASTSDLTALPIPSPARWKDKNGWIEGCRAVLSPGSKGNVGSRSRERDIEHGPSGF